MALGPPALDDTLYAFGVAERDDPHVAALEAVLPLAPTLGDAVIPRLPSALPRCGALPEGRLSPRMLVLLSKALETHAGQHVMLRGDPLVTLAAVLLRLPDRLRPARVTVLSEDLARATWTQQRLGIRSDRFDVRRSDETDVDDEAPERLLMLGDGRPAHQFRGHVARPGLVVSAAPDLRRPRWTQCVIDDQGGHSTMDLIEVRFKPRRDEGDDPIVRTTADGLPLRRFLRLEAMQGHIWRDAAPTRLEQNVRRAVTETFDTPDGPDDLMAHAPSAGPSDARLHLAHRLFHLAYLDQACGSREGAEALYQASIAAQPTAEAWTFYGWVRSQAGHIDEAIEACRAAIELDPGFGNPYNDIGAYMLAKGQAGAAKSWFRKAIKAPRYAALHYPYTNLGRLYLREGDLDAARAAVEHALDVMPGYPPAEKLLREIETRETRDPDQA